MDSICSEAQARFQKPFETSVLFSVHFSNDCFTWRIDVLGPENVSVEILKNRRLVKGSIPTIDTAGQVKKADMPDLTSRDKRMIMRQVSSSELDSAS